MISDILILEKIQKAFPEFKLAGGRLGKLYNVSMYTENEWYQFDVVESEVGVTYREMEGEMDFSGSDVAFGTLEEAIAFLIEYRSKL